MVEVAVVKITIPTDRDSVPAHQSRYGGRVEGADQFLHVVFVVARLEEVVQKPADGEVGDAIQLVENNVLVMTQWLFELSFDGYLAARQKCAN